MLLARIVQDDAHEIVSTRDSEQRRPAALVVPIGDLIGPAAKVGEEQHDGTLSRLASYGLGRSRE
jgi:hypothetical protein